jgi:hypothetical protein
MSFRGLASFVAVATCLSLSMSSRAADYPPRRELALQLVRVAEADIRLAEDANRILNSSSAKGFRCKAPVSRGELTEELARIAEHELTEAEMRDGIAYLRSDVGRKHLVLLRAVEEHRVNKPIPDAAERASMEAFLDSPVGYRLFTRGLLWRSELAQRVFWRVVRGRGWDDCPKAP